MQLTRAPESIRASIEKCWKSIGANSMRLFCLSAIAEDIGRHCSPIGLFVVVIFSNWWASSCKSKLLSPCCVFVGLGFPSLLGCWFCSNSQVSARLMRFVFGAGLAVVVVAGVMVGSLALYVSGTSMVEVPDLVGYFFIGYSGLWGDDGDDVIAARISFVGAGTLKLTWVRS